MTHNDSNLNYNNKREDINNFFSRKNKKNGWVTRVNKSNTLLSGNSDYRKNNLKV